MPEALKKLSVSKIIHDSGAPFGIFIGRVARFKPVNTTFGTSLQLKGNFRLQVPEFEGKDGKKIEKAEFDSNIAYVPSVVETAIEVALMDSNPATFKGLEIAVKLFKKDAPKSARGYEWAYDPIVAPSAENDPLAGLLDKVSKSTLALPEKSGEAKKPAGKK